MYDGNNTEMIEYYLAAKYYTDIDVEGLEPHVVCDYLCGDPKTVDIRNIMGDDFYFCRGMGYRIMEACRRRFEAEHGPAQLAKRLLNTDVDTNDAKTQELIEKLIDMKSALPEKEETAKVLRFGAKKAAESVRTGGATINLAKKD